MADIKKSGNSSNSGASGPIKSTNKQNTPISKTSDIPVKSMGETVKTVSPINQTVNTVSNAVHVASDTAAKMAGSGSTESNAVQAGSQFAVSSVGKSAEHGAKTANKTVDAGFRVAEYKSIKNKNSENLGKLNAGQMGNTAIGNVGSSAVAGARGVANVAKAGLDPTKSVEANTANMIFEGSKQAAELSAKVAGDAAKMAVQYGVKKVHQKKQQQKVTKQKQQKQQSQNQPKKSHSKTKQQNSSTKPGGSQSPGGSNGPSAKPKPAKKSGAKKSGGTPGKGGSAPKKSGNTAKKAAKGTGGAPAGAQNAKSAKAAGKEAKKGAGDPKKGNAKPKGATEKKKDLDSKKTSSKKNEAAKKKKPAEKSIGKKENNGTRADIDAAKKQASEKKKTGKGKNDAAFDAKKKDKKKGAKKKSDKKSSDAIKKKKRNDGRKDVKKKAKNQPIKKKTKGEAKRASSGAKKAKRAQRRAGQQAVQQKMAQKVAVKEVAKTEAKAEAAAAIAAAGGPVTLICVAVLAILLIVTIVVVMIVTHSNNDEMVGADWNGEYERAVTGLISEYNQGTHVSTIQGPATKPRRGYVAVDPKKIAYGSVLYIVSDDGKVYGWAEAVDTGGFTMDLKNGWNGKTNYGNTICDLWTGEGSWMKYNNYKEPTGTWGKPSGTVYVVEEKPLKGGGAAAKKQATGHNVEDYLKRHPEQLNAGMSGPTAGKDYVKWMEQVAASKKSGYNDNVHRYWKYNGNGCQDVDCSSFVYFALGECGYLGSDYKKSRDIKWNTGNMGPILQRHGFRNVGPNAKLQRGDIIWGRSGDHGHVEVYVGGGGKLRCVGAHGDYNKKCGWSRGGRYNWGEVSVEDWGSSKFGGVGIMAVYRYTGHK